MARRKSKNAAQRLVGIATTGMPAPIRTVAGSRLGTFLLILGIPLLLALGILQVSWNGWRPTLSINPERAQEVRQQVREKVQGRTDDLIDQWREEWKGDEPPPIGDRPSRMGDAPVRMGDAPVRAGAPPTVDPPLRIGDPPRVDREPTPSFRDQWPIDRRGTGRSDSNGTKQPILPWSARPPAREPRY